MIAPPTLDAIQADASDVSELLKLIYDVVGDLPFDRDGVRDPRMDALYSLARIGKGLAGQLVEALDATLTAQAKVRASARVN